jgi:dienelactone hydrolase
MNGEIVTVETADGVSLDGMLSRPSTAGQSRLPVDIVIMHHGVGGRFYRHGIFDVMSPQLVELVCAALPVNNRGHDTIYTAQVRGKSTLLGSAYEIVDDCRHDLAAWIDFAAAQGYQRIGLWGHSLGAVKTIYYLAEVGDPRVVCAVVSSPPRQNFENYLAQPAEERALFDHEYGLAKQAIDEGEPERLIATTYRRQTLFTPRTYVDKYGPESRYDIFRHLPRIKQPLFITWGGLEPLSDSASHVSFHQLPAEAKHLSATHPHIAYAEIDGGNHYYAGKTDQLWAAVERWYGTV